MQGYKEKRKENKADLIEIKQVDEIKMVLDKFQLILPQLSQSNQYRFDMSKKLLENAFFIALRLESDIIGFIAFYANDFVSHTAYVSLIAVDDGYRGLDYGRQLFEFACDRSCEMGMNKLKLEVLKNNTGAISFYRKMGLVYLCDASDESIYLIKRIGD